jgi:redox-sensitive bicupin YhaK (pirin superfamily)
MLLGGKPLDGERHIWWNFVASTTARIDQAARQWADHLFPEVPGDDERIPLPPA